MTPRGTDLLLIQLGSVRKHRYWPDPSDQPMLGAIVQRGGRRWELRADAYAARCGSRSRPTRHSGCASAFAGSANTSVREAARSRGLPQGRHRSLRPFDRLRLPRRQRLGHAPALLRQMRQAGLHRGGAASRHRRREGGALDDPNSPAPTAIIWTKSAPIWAFFDPDLPQTEGQPSGRRRPN